MSSETWYTDCPHCGFGATQTRRKGSYYEIDYCYTYSYVSTEPTEILFYEMYRNAQDELNRVNYKSDDAYKDAPEKMNLKITKEWLEEEEGKDVTPTKADIFRGKKITTVCEIIDSLIRHNGWNDYGIFISDYDLISHMDTIEEFYRELVNSFFKDTE